MHCIIYLSSAKILFSNDEIDYLLNKSRKYNEEHNITGFLLYIEGDILQVIEGKKETVLHLFEKIKLDHRHSTVIPVFNDTITSRKFDHWKMGFTSTTIQEIKKNVALKDFEIEKFKQNHNDFAMVFFESFVKSHRIEY